MTQAAQTAADQPPTADAPGASASSRAPDAPEATEPGRAPHGAPGVDPYEGLDDVTRAKQRLLDYGRQYDAQHPPRRAMRRPMCMIALGVFGVGVLSGALPRLRRLARRGLMMAAKRMLFRSRGRSSRKPRAKPAHR